MYIILWELNTYIYIYMYVYIYINSKFQYDYEASKLELLEVEPPIPRGSTPSACNCD